MGFTTLPKNLNYCNGYATLKQLSQTAATPQQYRILLSFFADTTYDSLADMQLIPLKKSQESEVALPGYDTVGSEIPASNSQTVSASNEALSSNPVASALVEYSVVRKKTAKNASNSGNEECVHSSSCTSEPPRQAVVTYSSLNQPLKSASENSEGVQPLSSEEAPPPPIPPPISQNNLLAMEAATHWNGNAATTSSEIEQEKTVSCDACEPDNVPQNDAAAAASTSGETSGGQGGQGECLYVNF